MHIRKNRLFTYQNIIIFASIMPIIVFGILTYNNSKKETTQSAFEYIQNINHQKKKIIQEYFQELEFDMNELIKTVSFLEKQAKNNIKNIQTLQKNNLLDYFTSVEKDLISLSKKDIFQYIYSFLQKAKTVDTVYFENIKSYKDELGFKNILMIAPNGKILYSSDRENMKNTYAKEFLSEGEDIFKSLKLKKNAKDVYFVNLSVKDAPKGYIQYAIIRFESVNGYIAMEINQDTLQKSIENVASLGDTAETYLVHRLGLKTYLATNRFKKKGEVGDEKSGFHIDEGFHSEGIDVKYGSLGDIELVGYRPVKIKNISLSMQTTVAYTDIISPLIEGADYFEQFVKDHNYHNLMLIGSKGDIFYSVTKENDYRTNIFSKKYEDTHLLKAVNEVVTTKKFVLSDLALYSSCSAGFAQFVLAPILKDDGSVQSIVVVQLNKDYLADLLDYKASALYNSYETYVVGKDKKLRSDTMLSQETYTVANSFNKNILMDSQALAQALIHKEGVSMLKDYRDTDVLSSYSTITYPNFEWIVITEVDAKEIEERLSGLKENISLFVLISSVLALLVMLVITNEKKKQDKKLYHTATHDALTGLPNRKFALEFLSYMLANQKRRKTQGAVLFIDLDKFKIINDSYGHEAGDKVLVEISLRLRKTLRDEDLVARLGGDEFIVIVNNFHSLSDIDKLCNKLIQTVSQAIQDKERAYEVGMSIGIATFPQDSSTAQELLQFADTAMFGIKDNGRNGYTYYNKEMTQRSLKVSRVEEELKYAIINNELELYFQPQIDIKNAKLIAVEALIRWNHPRDGLIMPDDFIIIAEESNLIIDLGYWVLREACVKFKAWKEQGIAIEYIAVNMSTKQLQDTECVKNISSVLDELDFKPEWLELEITENTLISNLQSTLSNINTFKEMGITFSIDDFGTGYSSLSYLKSLRISTLKIDREFVKDILSDKDDRSIVTAIIGMGHAMNYEIVAEGAENKEEVLLLKKLGCDIVQGYYYSKPLREIDLLAYIKHEEWIK